MDDITKCISCEINKIPQFKLSEICFIRLYNAISPLKSTPWTGSSKTSSSGFLAIALAIKTR